MEGHSEGGSLDGGSRIRDSLSRDPLSAHLIHPPTDVNFGPYKPAALELF